MINELTNLGVWLREEGILRDPGETVCIQMPKDSVFKLVCNFEVKRKIPTQTSINQDNKFESLMINTQDGTTWLIVEGEYVQAQ